MNYVLHFSGPCSNPLGDLDSDPTYAIVLDASLARMRAPSSVAPPAAKPAPGRWPESVPI